MTDNPAPLLGSAAIPADGLEMHDESRLRLAGRGDVDAGGSGSPSTTGPSTAGPSTKTRNRMTDQELIRAYVHERNLDCLDTFMRRYQDSLLRFARQFLGDGDLAQDVVQEAFLRVAKKPKRLLAVESCHNWLLRIVRNVGIDHIRKASRYRKHRDRAAELTPRTESTDDVASTELEQEELHEQVHHEIALLEPKKRELFLLKVQEGKSYREIAQITGLSVTNVGYHLHQIMRHLAQRLSDTQEGPR